MSRSSRPKKQKFTLLAQAAQFMQKRKDPISLMTEEEEEELKRQPWFSEFLAEEGGVKQNAISALNELRNGTAIFTCASTDTWLDSVMPPPEIVSESRRIPTSWKEKAVENPREFAAACSTAIDAAIAAGNMQRIEGRQTDTADVTSYASKNGDLSTQNLGNDQFNIASNNFTGVLKVERRNEADGRLNSDNFDMVLFEQGKIISIILGDDTLGRCRVANMPDLLGKMNAEAGVEIRIPASSVNAPSPDRVVSSVPSPDYSAAAQRIQSPLSSVEAEEAYARMVLVTEAQAEREAAVSLLMQGIQKESQEAQKNLAETQASLQRVVAAAAEERKASLAADLKAAGDSAASAHNRAELAAADAAGLRTELAQLGATTANTQARLEAELEAARATIQEARTTAEQAIESARAAHALSASTLATSRELAIELDRVQAEAEASQGALALTTRDLEQARTQLADKSAVMDASLNAAQEAANAARREALEAKARSENLQNQLNDTAQRLERLSADEAAGRELHGKQKEELTRLNARLTELQFEKDAAEARRKEAQQHLIAGLVGLRAITGADERLHKNLDEASTKVSTLEKRITSIKEREQALQTEVASLREQVKSNASLQTQLTEATSALAQITGQKEALSKELVEAREVIAKTHVEIAKLAFIQEIKGRDAIAQEEASARKGLASAFALGTQNAESIQVRRDKSELARKANELQKELDKATADRNKLAIDREQLQNELDLAKKEVTAAKKEAISRHTKYTARLTAAQQTIASLEEEKARLQHIADEVDARLDLAQQKQTAQGKILEEQMQRLLTTHEQALTKLGAEAAKAQKELITSRANAEALTASARTLEERIAALQGTKEKSKAQEAEITHLRAQLDGQLTLLEQARAEASQKAQESIKAQAAQRTAENALASERESLARSHERLASRVSGVSEVLASLSKRRPNNKTAGHSVETGTDSAPVIKIKTCPKKDAEAQVDFTTAELEDRTRIQQAEIRKSEEHIKALEAQIQQSRVERPEETLQLHRDLAGLRKETVQKSKAVEELREALAKERAYFEDQINKIEKERRELADQLIAANYNNTILISQYHKAHRELSEQIKAHEQAWQEDKELSAAQLALLNASRAKSEQTYQETISKQEAEIASLQGMLAHMASQQAALELAQDRSKNFKMDCETLGWELNRHQQQIRLLEEALKETEGRLALKDEKLKQAAHMGAILVQQNRALQQDAEAQARNIVSTLSPQSSPRRARSVSPPRARPLDR